MICHRLVDSGSETADGNKAYGAVTICKGIDILQNPRVAGVTKANMIAGRIKLLLGAKAHTVKLLFYNHTIGVSMGIIAKQRAMRGVRQGIDTVLVKMNGN